MVQVSGVYWRRESSSAARSSAEGASGSSGSSTRMRSSYAHALYNDPSASLDDLREAVTTLEDAERIARRVLGGAHPVMVDMERSLRVARAALRAREAQPGEA